MTSAQGIGGDDRGEGSHDRLVGHKSDRVNDIDDACSDIAW